ncbi:hypothetical protein [Bradyrhizobium prioriisuperbiae]|uniref:hypothetical protein n=1 Tax=Bradyrhizobium prioriisuperbiae TaxID=2854389 RepID=UPI0028E581F3|nr:hypothetical protein [Bradyrhizobium prioritasuperba]
MGRRLPIWFNAGALLLVSWIAVASLSLRLPAGAEVAAVVFPPWWSAQQAMTATASANAAVIRTGILPAILIVQLAGPDGLQRLRDAGVWLALDPRAIGGCAPP